MRWRIVDLANGFPSGSASSSPSRPCVGMLRKIGLSQAFSAAAPSGAGRGIDRGFQKTYGPPRLQGDLSRSAADQSASTYPASEVSSRPRWRYARPGPHKLPGVERRFLNQASRTPFDCQAISSSPSRKHLLAVGRSASDRPNSRPPSAFLWRRSVLRARSTAQAILASLLAKATTATL